MSAAAPSPPSLEDLLTASDRRPAVLSACEDLVEREVRARKGVGGMAIKAGYKVVRAIKPGIVQELLGAMLPEFARALDPFYQRARAQAGDGGVGGAWRQILSGEADAVAEALLAVTDRRAERAKNAALKKTYARLRPSAKAQVITAVPNLADTLVPFLDAP